MCAPTAAAGSVCACVCVCQRGTEHRAGRVLERVSAVLCSCCRRRCRCHRRRQRRHLSAARTIFVGSKRKPNSRQAFPSANSHIQELKPKRHSSGPAATATQQRERSSSSTGSSSTGSSTGSSSVSGSGNLRLRLRLRLSGQKAS